MKLNQRITDKGLEARQPANGWNEYSKFVLKELERLNESQESIVNEVTKTRINVARLQVKSGIWGLMGGLIPSISVLLYILIKSI